MKTNPRDAIKKIFFQIFPDLGKKSFNFEMDRSEFENWDSLSHMQLISEIENAFSLSFEMDEVVEINKPEDLVRLVEKKING